MNNIMNFTAKDAINIVNSLQDQELFTILTEIKSAAEIGGRFIIYEDIKRNTYCCLKDKGFRITMSDCTIISKEERQERKRMIYTIFW